jgi:HlyD family secretion protein
MYQQASSVYEEAKTIYRDLYIKAPIGGEISNKIAEEGEVVGAGYPVFTIQVPEDNHVVLNIREDKLSRFKMGAVMKGRLAALDNKEFDFRVSYLAPLADFATWAPTRDKGEFDLKTFEIHLKPQAEIPDIRPGMTVQIYLED